jgi:hypothetical protein
MCTRANRASVSDSFHAVAAALFALASAVVALAAATIPWRTLRSRPTTRARVDSAMQIEIQVHLSDGERVRAIERSCRTGLKRAARTWAPFALPLDRVEVIPSAPPLGKTDIFDEWFTGRSGHGAQAGALVVVSLGTSQEGRELSPDEIAGALVGQVERLVIDRYRREHQASTPAPDLNIRVARLEQLVDELRAEVADLGAQLHASIFGAHVAMQLAT